MLTAEELIERVRDELGDYGDVEEGSASALTETLTDSATEMTVENAADFDIGDWLYCEYEVMEVSGESDTSAQTVPIRRAMKGTTAAEHASGTLVRANLKFSSKRILDVLNGSLAGAFPMLAKVVEDTSLVVVDGQRLYELENPVRDMRSFWLEDAVGSEKYLLCRVAVPQSRSTFTLHGSHTPGLGIKVVCTNVFDRLTAGEELDDDFPDDDEAYAYLVKETAARLLLQRTGERALDDSAPARGSSGQDDRYVLLNTAKALKQDATDSLRTARMQLPKRISPRPDARYYD